VVYGSRFGSTRDVAHRIADRLRRAGHGVDVRAAGETVDVSPYCAVVLGSGVYNGSWTRETNELIRRASPLLARRAVWLFSLGTFGDRHPIVGRFMTREPREIDEFTSAIRPRDYRVFAGVIDGIGWPRIVRGLVKLLGVAGDRRDWADIDTWADGIARDVAVLAAPCCSNRPIAAAS
jgi:menaquinone-dependent protoporphyrinogen oxidase